MVVAAGKMIYICSLVIPLEKVFKLNKVGKKHKREREKKKKTINGVQREEG